MVGLASFCAHVGGGKDGVRFSDQSNLTVQFFIFYGESTRCSNYKSNLSLYSLYYAEACNQFAGLISAALRPRSIELLSKKCCSGGEPLATLCPIRPARDLNLRSSAPEMNAFLSLQLYVFDWLENRLRFVVNGCKNRSCFQLKKKSQKFFSCMGLSRI